MPSFTLSGLLIGIIDYIVPLDFDHIKLVSKPGPKEWPDLPALPSTPFLLMPCWNSLQETDGKVESSTESSGLQFIVHFLHPGLARAGCQAWDRARTLRKSRPRLSCLAGTMEPK